VRDLEVHAAADRFEVENANPLSPAMCATPKSNWPNGVIRELFIARARGRMRGITQVLICVV
jgi:hypothetical protein